MSNPLMSAGTFTSVLVRGWSETPTASPCSEIGLFKISSINPDIRLALSELLPIILLNKSSPSISEKSCPACFRSCGVADGFSAVFIAAPISSKLAPLAYPLDGSLSCSSSSYSCGTSEIRISSNASSICSPDNRAEGVSSFSSANVTAISVISSPSGSVAACGFGMEATGSFASQNQLYKPPNFAPKQQGSPMMFAAPLR